MQTMISNLIRLRYSKIFQDMTLILWDSITKPNHKKLLQILSINPTQGSDIDKGYVRRPSTNNKAFSGAWSV